MKRVVSIILLVVMLTSLSMTEIAYSMGYHSETTGGRTAESTVNSAATPDGYVTEGGSVTNGGEVQGIWDKIKKVVCGIIAFVIDDIIEKLLEYYCEQNPLACYRV